MKVISIGTDKSLFKEGSKARGRMIEYGEIFEELHIIVFSLKNQGVSEKSKISDNVFIYSTDSKSKIFYIFDYLKIAKNIIKNNENKSLVLTAQDPFETGFVGLLLKMRYKLPLQIQVHTDFANKYFISHSALNLIRFPLGLFVLSCADSVRVVSERVFNSVRSLAHNISVLPIYTPKNSNSSKEDIKKTDKVINFLTVARLEKEKDVKTAILAFKKVIDRGIEATFTIVGDGSQRKDLELLARKLNIQEKFTFVGWQNNLEDYYKNADVYISTSLYEGYGMSVMEAASSGLPLVLSDAGIGGFVFKNKKEALVFKPGDVDGFSHAMYKFATDSSLREEFGKKAKEEADKNVISFDEYLNKYKDSLEKAREFQSQNHGIFKKNILVRYLVSGITAASTNIILLYVITDVLDVWYLYSSIIAFVISVAISFFLQKFWTFRDGDIKNVQKQFSNYMVVALLGVFANTALMYLLVDVLNIWYLLSQIFTGIVIAVFNFLMYKFFIFNK